jgi:hypothetical protein
MCGQLETAIPLAPGGEARYPLCRTPSRSELYGEGKHLLRLPETEPRLLFRLARRLVAILRYPGTCLRMYVCMYVCNTYCGVETHC